MGLLGFLQLIRLPGFIEFYVLSLSPGNQVKWGNQVHRVNWARSMKRRPSAMKNLKHETESSRQPFLIDVRVGAVCYDRQARVRGSRVDFDCVNGLACQCPMHIRGGVFLAIPHAHPGKGFQKGQYQQACGFIQNRFVGFVEFIFFISAIQAHSVNGFAWVHSVNSVTFVLRILRFWLTVAPAPVSNVTHRIVWSCESRMPHLQMQISGGSRLCIESCGVVNSVCRTSFFELWRIRRSARPHPAVL